MTCIVGLALDGVVYMGGDSAGSDGWNMEDRVDAKVFHNGPFLFGFTSSFRMGQLLRYAFYPPQPKVGQDVMAFMAVDFINAVRDCLKAGGYARKDSEAEKAGTFLVGYAGRLFKVEGDYQVGEQREWYAACGCGAPYALGSLHSTAGREPADRITMALHAAERHSAGVRGPFVVLDTRQGTQP